MPKLILSLTCLISLAIACHSRVDRDTNKEPVEMTKTYYVGFITRGPAWTPEVTDAVNKLQEEHLANIDRLADSGLLVLAGPFWDEENRNTLRGLFFFDVDSVEEAQRLCDTDPAVNAGRLVVDIFPWVAPPGLTYREPVEMTTYLSVLYQKGPSWSAHTETPFEELLQHHIKTLETVSDSGAIILAGPFVSASDSNPAKALIIAKADSLGQWQQVVSSLPAVQSAQLEATVLHWYGPEGLRFEK